MYNTELNLQMLRVNVNLNFGGDLNLRLFQLIHRKPASFRSVLIWRLSFVFQM